MADQLVCWCVEQLKCDFGLDVSEDVVQYILSINEAEEIAEYVGDLVQGTDGKKKQFTNELLQRWCQSRRPSPGNSGSWPKKEAVSEAPDAAKDSLRKSKRKGRNKQEVTLVPELQPEPDAVKTPIDLMKVRGAQEGASGLTGKKKTKFVSLYGKEGQDRLAVLLPGRHPCECLAQKHPLVNNCLTCGRIVCQQEGSGLCLFCGSLVCTKEEQEILQRDSNKSQKLRKKLMGDHGTVAEGAEKEYLPSQEARMKAGLEKAIQHKDKLLEFDRNSVRRTQVLDDESDYFATDSNQWLSQAEREVLRQREEELRQLRHASRRDRKVTLDFAGRRVLEEGDNLGCYYRKFDEAVQAIKTGSLVQSPTPVLPEHRQDLRELLNPNIVSAAPVWVDVGGHNIPKKPLGLEPAGGAERTRLRLQDPELQEMADGGWCLSMHQPWATLLVKGIKRVEGRTWYTPHRGRLWIAAAAKRPAPQEVAQVEAMYRQLCSKELRFPKEYPTGCLLGCVNVTECLPQEQYREQFPDTCEESASPFVFVCTNPQELLVKFPIKGKHKIWKLDSVHHQAAKKGLMLVRPAV
ncbi:activating signal cointegrator 1 isoform X2 [Arapaima gigas]